MPSAGIALLAERDDSLCSLLWRSAWRIVLWPPVFPRRTASFWKGGEGLQLQPGTWYGLAEGNEVILLFVFWREQDLRQRPAMWLLKKAAFLFSKTRS